MFVLLRYAEVVSKSRQPVLITGETGVGKELVAKAVHSMSGLRGGFVCINIAGLDDLMFSDTLFGHCKGAYTGAHSDRDGLIMKATNGTITIAYPAAPLASRRSTSEANTAAPYGMASSLKS